MARSNADMPAADPPVSDKHMTAFAGVAVVGSPVDPVLT